MSNCIYFAICEGIACNDCPYFVANWQPNKYYKEVRNEWASL